MNSPDWDKIVIKWVWKLFVVIRVYKFVIEFNFSIFQLSTFCLNCRKRWYLAGARCSL